MARWGYPAERVVAFADRVNVVHQHLDDAERAPAPDFRPRYGGLQAPVATVGTGARSTRKRALAAQLALDGVGLDAIAEAAALSPRRVEQVLSNVAAHGLAALYPSFAEPFLKPEDPSTQQLMDEPAKA